VHLTVTETARACPRVMSERGLLGPNCTWREMLNGLGTFSFAVGEPARVGPRGIGSLSRVSLACEIAESKSWAYMFGPGGCEDRRHRIQLKRL